MITELAMVFLLSAATGLYGIFLLIEGTEGDPFFVCVDVGDPLAIPAMPANSGHSRKIIRVGSTILRVLSSSTSAKVQFSVVQGVMITVVDYIGRQRIKDFALHKRYCFSAICENFANRVIGLCCLIPTCRPTVSIDLIKVLDINDCEQVFAERNVANGYVFRNRKRLTHKTLIAAGAAKNRSFGFSGSAGAQIVIGIRSHNESIPKTLEGK